MTSDTSRTLYAQDEYGQYLCPLTERVVWDDGEAVVTKSGPCRKPLYLTLAGNVPIADDVAPDWTFGAAITTAWTVECENGHVLLRSAGEEMAEPFALKDLLEGSA